MNYKRRMIRNLSMSKWLITEKVTQHTTDPAFGKQFIRKIACSIEFNLMGLILMNSAQR